MNPLTDEHNNGLSSTEQASWQKLSRWSILHSVIQGIRGSILILLAALTVNSSTATDSTWIGLIVVSALIGLNIVISILGYMYFSYQILEEAIQVRRGVLFKKQLNLKFQRIQNINIKHPFYFRPLGLVTLKIDGAGARGEEVQLSALSLETAQSIRQFIQEKRQHKHVDSTAIDIESGGEVKNISRKNELVGAVPDEVFFTRTFWDLVIHGLTNNRAWLILVGLFAMSSYTPYSFSDVIDWLRVQVSFLVSSQSAASLIMLFTLSFVLAVLITALLSVLGSILTYYDFTLYGSTKSLMVHRGLINKHEINMQKSRVQTIVYRQDWLDLVLGRANVIYEQISHTAYGNEGTEIGKKILVPSVRTHELTRLAEQILPIGDVEKLNFRAISKRYFYKHAVIWSAIYIVIGLLIGWVDLALPKTWWVAVAVVLSWLIHIILIYMTWKRAGFAQKGDFIVVRKGVIGIDYVIFPAYKIQAMSHVQSFLMKRHDLSNLVFHTASRSVKVIYLPTSFVKEVIDYCLYSAESSNKSWM